MWQRFKEVDIKTLFKKKVEVRPQGYQQSKRHQNKERDYFKLE